MKWKHTFNALGVLLLVAMVVFIWEGREGHGYTFLAEENIKNRAKVSKAVDLLLFALAEGVLEIDFENFDE